MKTAGEFRAEAERLRKLAESVTDDATLRLIHEQIAELEARARQLENGSS